jgi:hypothetical protein
MVSSTDEHPSVQDESDIITPVPDSSLTHLEDHLKTWYEEISPRYVDLVSDFAGQEFFLLDGEALLQYLFNDPMLDLAGSKGGTNPIPLIPLLVNHQDFKCCTSCTLWNGSSKISFADDVFFRLSFSMVEPGRNVVDCRFCQCVCFE